MRTVNIPDCMTLFRRLCLASTLATFAQISIGGMVRATKSGLGCGTDWPDCGGRLLPALETRAEIIEFSHRAAASLVVMLIAATAAYALWKLRDHPRLVWASLAALGLVLFQAVLGAAVVIFELKADLVVVHLATAMALLALLVVLSTDAAAREGTLDDPVDPTVSRSVMNAAGAILGLVLVGSYVTGRGAGFVFKDWPLMDGKLIPDLTVPLYALHFFHRALAAVVGVYVIWSMLRIARRRAELPTVARLASAVIVLFGIEVMIGAANVWTGLNAASVTAHLMTASAIWGALVTMAAIAHPALRTARVRSPRAEPAFEAGS
jgi:heme a synthase